MEGERPRATEDEDIKFWECDGRVSRMPTGRIDLDSWRRRSRNVARHCCGSTFSRVPEVLLRSSAQDQSLSMMHVDVLRAYFYANASRDHMVGKFKVKVTVTGPGTPDVLRALNRSIRRSTNGEKYERLTETQTG